MDDFNADEVLKSSVDKVSVQLANLTDEQLSALHDAEHKGQKRTTMLNAIDREIAARQERAQGGEGDLSGGVVSGGVEHDADATGRHADDAGGEASDIVTKGTIATKAGDAAREANAPPAVSSSRELVERMMAAADNITSDDDVEGFAKFVQALDVASVVELQKLTDGMSALGYSLDGGPEDASQVDKVLLVVSALSADRDELRDQVRTLEALTALDAGEPDANGPVYSQVQVDKLLNDQRDAFERDKREAIDRAVAQATTPLRKPGRAGKPLAIDAKAVAPIADVLRAHASTVTLVDVDGVAIADLTPLAFDGSAFRFEGGRAVLNRELEPPRGGAEREVFGAFVSVDGKPIGRAELVAPFAVGGGRRTTLPPGTLSFGGAADQVAL